MMYSLLKKTKTCQICNKSFTNGKALGGHMRTHTQKLHVQCRKSERGAESSTNSTIPPLQTSNKLVANFSPRERVLTRSVRASEVAVVPKPNISKKGGQEITGKRKIFKDLDEENPIKFQCSFQDIETALCLIEMSKKKCTENCPTKAVNDVFVSTRKEKNSEKYIEVDSKDDTNLDDEETYYKYLDQDEDIKDGDVKFLASDVGTLTEESDEDSEDSDTDDDSVYLVAREEKRKKPSDDYQCDICGKVLRSYQALGGHRTNHTNKRLKISDKKDQAVKQENGAVLRRHFKCQICDRVFESGQALGGHKKIHYAFLKPIN